MLRSVVDNRFQCARQRGRRRLHFFPVKNRKLFKNRLAGRRQLNQHFTAILVAMAAHDRASLLQPVNQFDRAVMF